VEAALKTGGNCNRCNKVLRIADRGSAGSVYDMPPYVGPYDYVVRNHWTSEKYLVAVVPADARPQG
jgi:hypothetical protein